MKENRAERLESYVPILRGLISYHKRMMVLAASPCHYSESGEWKNSERAADNNGECPKATVLNDVYLGALEESLMLIEREIAILKRG